MLVYIILMDMNSSSVKATAFDHKGVEPLYAIHCAILMPNILG